MRTCRHLKPFKITVEVIDAAKAGLPPWGAMCENCAFTVVEALRLHSRQIADSQPGGKSLSSQTWIRIKSLIKDWGLVD